MSRPLRSVLLEVSFCPNPTRKWATGFLAAPVKYCCSVVSKYLRKSQTAVLKFRSNLKGSPLSTQGDEIKITHLSKNKTINVYELGEKRSMLLNKQQSILAVSVVLSSYLHVYKLYVNSCKYLKHDLYKYILFIHVNLPANNIYMYKYM